jgi:hypothetical protein
MADFIGIQVNNADADDFRAAQYIIDIENARRAALDPPETPLPDSTNAEVKASYESMLLEIIDKAHTSYKKQASEQALANDNIKSLWESATDAERQAAITALGG